MRSKAIVQCPACGILGGGSPKRPTSERSWSKARRTWPRTRGWKESRARVVLSTPKEYANWRGEHQGEAAGASA
jgi:hypothetical protein